MVKKTKPTSLEPNPSGVPNRDVLNRLNFMYQAAVLLAAIVPQPHPTSATSPLAAQLNQVCSLLPTQPCAAGTQDVTAPVAESLAGSVNSDLGLMAGSAQPAKPTASTSKLPTEPRSDSNKRRRMERLRGEGCAVLASRVLVKNMANVANKATIRM